MLNISIIILLSFILVYSNVIILNEETLILVCFVAFSLITFNKLKDSISQDLQKDSNKIELFLLKSFKDLLNSLELVSRSKSTFNHIVINFQFLKEHFIIYSTVTSKELPNYVSNSSETIYPKKLIFVERLENQTSKLLALLVNHKLDKITSVQNFYTHSCKVTNFLCVNKVIFREYLQII
uniref:ATP synthase F0 subunit b n=1 Tax=Hypnea nidulans TaxID=673449 RepID=UPI003003A10D|nr:ATP synthase F0 subunit b [Hypnea nidulans]